MLYKAFVGVLMPSLRFFFVLVMVLGSAAPAFAELQGTAARDDNCTPYNTYKVGFSTGRGTIVNQSLVLAEGWSPAGWIIEDASHTKYFLGYVGFFAPKYAGLDAGPSTGPLSLYPLTGQNDLQSRVHDFVTYLSSAGVKQTDLRTTRLPPKYNIVPCFTAPLPLDTPPHS